MSASPNLPPKAGALGFIHHAGDAPAYWMQGLLWTMLADGEETGGRWSMMEQLLPKGSGPPPHKHLWSDETFYILDGEVTFLVEGEIRTAGKGAFVMVARNTRHAFRVDSDTARFLNGYTPASMEALVAEFVEASPGPQSPPQPAAPPGQMSDDLLMRYGLAWIDEADPLEPRGHRPESAVRASAKDDRA